MHSIHAIDDVHKIQADRYLRNVNRCATERCGALTACVFPAHALDRAQALHQLITRPTNHAPRRKPTTYAAMLSAVTARGDMAWVMRLAEAVRLDPNDVNVSRCDEA